MRKQNGREGSSFSVSVDTNAQLLSAAYSTAARHAQSVALAGRRAPRTHSFPP